MPTRNPPFVPQVVSDEEVDNYEYDGDYIPDTPIEEVVASHPSNTKPIAKENSIQAIPAPGSQVALKTTYSRTVRDSPSREAGWIKAEFELTEVFPGEMQAEEIAKVAEAQYQVLKSTVLSELGLPFTQDETTGMIMETFPGSTVVASAPAEQAPRVAAQARQAAPPSNPPAPRQQARTAPSSPRSGATPRPNVLWQELFDYPGDWFWNRNKQNANQPDYISTRYINDKGYPVGLWTTSQYQGASCPNPDLLATYDPADFAQDRPIAQR